MATADNTVQVMIGSLAEFADLLEPTVADPLLQTGGIGLDGMANEVVTLVLAHGGVIPALASLWAGNGSGVQEEPENSGAPIGTVTVQNTTSTDIYIPVEGATFSTASGERFLVLGNIHAAGWAAGSGGLGGYIVHPGSRLSIAVESTSYGPPAAVAQNALTGSSIAGLSVVASSAMGAAESFTDPSKNDQGGFYTTKYGEYPTIYTAQGFAPAESQVNVDTAHEMSGTELASWEGYVDNARSVGILNVAPIYSDSNYALDLTQPFATSPWFANVRAAALYGGGLSFDLPPDYWFNRTWDDYQQNVIEQIRWATANGLRSSVIISADSYKGYNANFASQTLQLLQQLKAEDALPSQIVVENYSGEYPNLYDSTNTDPNSLNAVALEIQKLGIGSPTASEAGLEVKNTSTAQTTLVMTGVQTEESLADGQSLTPWSIAQVHGVSPSQTLTVTVHDASGLLALADPAGIRSVSPGGSLSFTGTPASATAFLDQVTASATSSPTGTAELEIDLVDSKGQRTSAVTPVHVGIVQPIFSAISSASSSGAAYLRTGDTITWALIPSQRVTVSGGTPALLLSNTQFATYVGQRADGALLFTHQVWNGEPGDGLTVRALRLNGATIANASGIAVSPDAIDAVLPAAGIFNIDTADNKVVGVDESAQTALSTGGAQVAVYLDCASPVSGYSGGGMTLTMNDGGLANFAGISSGGRPEFLYFLPQGGTAQNLAPLWLNLNGNKLLDAKGEPLDAPASMPAVSGGGVSYDTTAPETLPDTVTFAVAEDAYKGDAIASFTIDGVTVGTVTVTALRASGSVQYVTFQGQFGNGGTHQLGVTFTNDLYAGPGQDRNLYLQGATWNGTSLGLSNAFMHAGTANATIAAPADDHIALFVSEDAFQGNARFSVMIDGKALSQIFTTQASHASGASQEIDINGAFGGSSVGHTVSLTFLNDAYTSGAGNDRNLYVQSVSFDGQQATASNELGMSGQSEQVSTLAGTDTLKLTMSEDAWNGDAQCYVTIDGKAVGGLETITASHGSRAEQTLTFTGAFGSGAHVLGVNFINDAWGGSAAADRNVYLDSVTYDGALQTGVAGEIGQTGLQDFAFGSTAQAQAQAPTTWNDMAALPAGAASLDVQTISHAKVLALSAPH